MISASIERCAGIDVGKKWPAVCIMVGPLDAEPRSETRKFGTNVADLEHLRDWLQENGITHAADQLFCFSCLYSFRTNLCHALVGKSVPGIAKFLKLLPQPRLVLL